MKHTIVVYLWKFFKILFDYSIRCAFALTDNIRTTITIIVTINVIKFLVPLIEFGISAPIKHIVYLIQPNYILMTWRVRISIRKAMLEDFAR